MRNSLKVIAHVYDLAQQYISLEIFYTVCTIFQTNFEKSKTDINPSFVNETELLFTWKY